ncbi:MAG: hypothetical protein M1813_008721 [Trichoglossum hirsutum]|nr:MAG: hypothetical protein M1813_008721 [Trichoglossum hirsutum]
MTGEADHQLLLSILATHTIVLNHAAIAERIGPHCTPRAVVERVKKLKKISKDGGFDKGGGSYVPKASKATGSNSKRKNITPDDTPSPKKAKADIVKLEGYSDEIKDIVGMNAAKPAPTEYSAAYESENHEQQKRNPTHGDSTNGAGRATYRGEPKKELLSPIPELPIDSYAYEPLNLYGHHDDLLIPFDNGEQVP